MRFLRKNTAVIVSVGPFYDKTDGVTIETGLTISNERITLVADTADGNAPTNILDNVTGATSGTDNDLNYITGNDAGMMQLELTAANTNRNGSLLLSITDAANHCPVFHEFQILPQAIYDALMTGAAVADGLLLGSAAYKIAVDSAGKVAVPDTQKVDVETIKTKSVTVDAGGTTFPASIHAAGAAVAKSPATLDWSADVSNKPTIGTSTLTAQQVWEHNTRVLTANTNLGLPASWPASWNWNTVTPDAAGTAATLISALQSHGDATWATATGFAAPGDAMTLTSAYDAAKTAAPANTALSNVVWTNAKAGYLDAPISGVAGLDAAGVRGAIGMESADMDDQLGAILAQATAAAGAGAGTGARAITFTVTTGGAAIQGVTVRLYRTGSVDRVGQTGSAGTVTLNADVDATWSYMVTHPLYDGATGTVVVDGNESVPVNLTAMSWPASTEPDTVTVRALVRGSDRQPIGAGSLVRMRVKSVPATVKGIWDKGLESDETDASSYVYFADVPKGAVLLFLAGANQEPQEVTVATDATSPYDVGPIYGVWA